MHISPLSKELTKEADFFPSVLRDVSERNWLIKWAWNYNRRLNEL
jgi:hypothetical protein